MRTPVGDWRLDVETLLDAPLDQSLQAFQGQVSSTVFFDLSLAARWHDSPRWFPPHAYVQREPCLYRTDAQGRLHVLGILSPYVSTSPEDFVLRFSHLTGVDPFTTQLVEL